MSKNLRILILCVYALSSRCLIQMLHFDKVTTTLLLVFLQPIIMGVFTSLLLGVFYISNYRYDESIRKLAFLALLIFIVGYAPILIEFANLANHPPSQSELVNSLKEHDLPLFLANHPKLILIGGMLGFLLSIIIMQAPLLVIGILVGLKLLKSANHKKTLP